MHVTEFRIENLPPFTEKVSVDLDRHANVFVGPNGTGKSTILRMLESRTDRQGQFLYWLSDDWPGITDGHLFTKETADAIPWIYIPATRVNLPLSHDGLAMSRLQASRWMDPENIVTDQNRGELHTLLTDSLYVFNGDVVRRASKAITDLFRSGHDTEASFMRKLSVKLAAYECAQRICKDLLEADDEPSDFVHNQPVRDSDLTVTNVYDDMGINISRRDNSRVFLGDLSSGTQGTLLWVWYLALRISDYYKYEPGWQAQPAILLIDEIENHLHPTWQRRVIPALLEHFPGLQIFATTHSPFVVAGMKAGQVHLLNRDASGVITASTNTEDIVGWTADEILRTMMGVDDPTDDATAAAARELRQLRNEGPGDTAEAEEQRQERMQQLRRLVDRDLLAGGPMAAQRELFEQQFNEALEKYQQSRDLSQENG